MDISRDLQENIRTLQEIFRDCPDIIQRRIQIAHRTSYVLYVDSMIDRNLIEGDVLKNLLYELKELPDEQTMKYLQEHAILTVDTKTVSDMDIVVLEVLSGNTLLFLNETPLALSISSKKFPTRGVQSAESEVSVRGPKDSFTESMRWNTVLIRRRIRDPHLKSWQTHIGTRSQTDVSLMYMEDIARPEILHEIQEKLKDFKIDGIFDCGSLEQLTEEKWYSPFPQFQMTERPDKAASALLDGRIVLVVDNSPMVLLLPTTLNCFFQAADDYYNRWGIVCFVRVLRYVAALIATILPGLYIGIACYHPEMLPTSLELSFSAARNGVPFPIPLEVLLLELAFELLREAGIRLPGAMGSALGIVGGLIIGQAAVDASIVSPIVVIIVALTALSSFTIPNEAFASAFRQIKFMLILLAAFWGFYGVILGMLAVWIHLAGLTSFHIPYLMPFVAVKVENNQDFKDGIIRFPLFKMKKRPIFSKEDQRVRFRKGD